MTELIVGGYENAGTTGLYRLVVGDRSLMLRDLVPGIVNMSGGVRVPGTQRWFVVDETVSRVLLIDGAAGWQVVANTASGGKGPCHLALSPAGDALAVANYDSGHVSVLPIGDDGLPGEARRHREDGSGPNADRQDGPHAHWVGYRPDGRLIAVDLGTDRVLSFSGPGLAGATVAHAAPPGSGPRQIAFHPTLPRAYLLAELASALTVLDCSGELWRVIDRVSTLPAGSSPDSLGGAIAIDGAGTRLFVSNRGHDSVATFAVDEDGSVRSNGHVPSGGQSPRFLLIVEDQLVVAHEQSGGVTLLPFRADGAPGQVAARVDVPSAAFVGATA